MLACSLFILITAVVVPCLTWAMRIARGGSLQSQYTIQARQSEIRIMRYVQNGKAIAVFTNAVQIMMATNVVASVYYADMDNNASTLSNNVLRYDPDVTETGGETTIVGWVSPIPGEPMFTNLDLSPMAVRMSYHIGEGTNPVYSSRFGSSPGFQGLEVRFSATPRNLQTWYQ